MLDLKQGKADRALNIRDFTMLIPIHPVPLSNTIKEATGHSTLDLYEERLLHISKELLITQNLIIAMLLTYDPYNFARFFKAVRGLTPKKFRQQQFLSAKAL